MVTQIRNQIKVKSRQWKFKVIMLYFIRKENVMVCAEKMAHRCVNWKKGIEAAYITVWKAYQLLKFGKKIWDQLKIPKQEAKTVEDLSHVKYKATWHSAAQRKIKTSPTRCIKISYCFNRFLLWKYWILFFNDARTCFQVQVGKMLTWKEEAIIYD